MSQVKPKVPAPVSSYLLSLGKAQQSAIANAPKALGLNTAFIDLTSFYPKDENNNSIRVIYNTISEQLEISFSNLKKQECKFDQIEDCLLEGDQRPATLYLSPSEKKYAIAHLIVYGDKTPVTIRGCSVIAKLKDNAEPLSVSADEIKATFGARVVTRGESKGTAQPALPPMPHEYSTEHVIRFASKIRVGGGYTVVLDRVETEQLIIKG